MGETVNGADALLSLRPPGTVWVRRPDYYVYPMANKFNKGDWAVVSAGWIDVLATKAQAIREVKGNLKRAMIAAESTGDAGEGKL